MTIKSKISLFISIIFTALFAVICVIIVSLFSNFREHEFEERLSEKALTSIKLLIDVKEVDHTLLKIIDQNTINQLYNEKTLIFDTHFKLIYSSLDDTKIDWNTEDLNFLKKNNSFFKKEGSNEVYGLYYDSNKIDYYVIVSATDNYGNRKLNFLIYTLISVGLLFIIAIWIFTFYIIKKQLSPLNIFHKKIRNINDLNSITKLDSSIYSNNEIDLISNEFNFMMNRINEVYQKQKEFTAHASHEFRTPLARISMQIENKMLHCSDHEKLFLEKIFREINQLNELINSLLLLSKLESNNQQTKEIVRIDEVIYDSIDEVSKELENFKINLNIDEFSDIEHLIEVNSNYNLLKIVFINILKNAYYYSDNKAILIEIKNVSNKLVLHFENTGTTVPTEEQEKLFDPFMRSKNAEHHNGLGLGLPIVKRILATFGFKVTYQAGSNHNLFIIHF